MMSSTNGFCDLFRYNGTGRIRPQNATDSIICYSIKRRGLSINRVNFLSDFYLRRKIITTLPLWLSFYFPQFIFRSENNFALVRVWPSIELKRLPGELARLQVETGCGVQWYRDFKVGLIIAEAKFLEKIPRYKNYLGNISKKFIRQHSNNVF